MMTFAPTIARRAVGQVRIVTLFTNGLGSRQLPGRARRWVERFVRRAAGSPLPHPTLGTLLRDSHGVIAVSERIRGLAFEGSPEAPETTVIIPPPALIATDEDAVEGRRIGRELLSLRPEQFAFVYFGHFYPGKGVETLIAAFAALSTAHPEYRLVLAGGRSLDAELGALVIDYRSALHAQISAHGLEPRVIWTGGYEPGSLLPSRWLRAADACVLPFEDGVRLNNSSFVAAAALGLPILTTAGEDHEPVFRDRENVLLVPPRQSAAMAAAMTELRADPELRARLSAGALALWRDCFSPTDIIARTAAFLQSCAAR
jgi:glycosyltransferase involved in cell wall biosynthesis